MQKSPAVNGGAFFALEKILIPIRLRRTSNGPTTGPEDHLLLFQVFEVCFLLIVTRLIFLLMVPSGAGEKVIAAEA